MDMRKLGFKVTMISFLLSTVFVLSTCMVYAGDNCQLINIRKEKAGGGSIIRVVPEKVTVPVGTCTVWINFVRDGKVHVSFRENAKQCILSTNAPTGFKQLELETGETCYDSGALSFGKTASLYWTQPGKYKYTLETPKGKNYGGNTMVEGIIEVK